MSKVLIVKSAAAAQSASFAPTVTGGGNAAMQMNLPAGKGVTGYGRIVPALGAAWGALNTLADDSQGDLFSSMGQAGMRGYTGYQAASQALGPAQRYAQQFSPADAHRRFNKLRGVAPPEHRAQQIAVRRERAAQPTVSPDFEAPKDFDASMFNGGYTNFGNAQAPQNDISHVGAMVGQANKEQEGSMQAGQQAQDQISQDLEAVKNQEDLQRRVAKSVRHWSYY